MRAHLTRNANVRWHAPRWRSISASFRHPRSLPAGEARLTGCHADSSWDKQAVEMIDKYVGGSAGSKAQRSRRAPEPVSSQLGNGVLVLLAINYAVFAAGRFVYGLDRILPLFAFKLQWWQAITYAFYHKSFAHLTGNMFMLWAFGKAVEQEEGAWGVILYYVLCAVGSAAAFAITSPRGVCIGASGAVFGLYVIALGVLLRNFSLRKLLEVVAITPFVAGQITSNVAAQVGGGALGATGGNIAYMGHLGGALTGLLLCGLNFAVPRES